MRRTAITITAASLAALALAACGGADIDAEATRASQPVASAPTYEPVQDVAGAVERFDDSDFETGIDDDDTVELDTDEDNLASDDDDAPIYRDVTDYSLDPK